MASIHTISRVIARWAPVYRAWRAAGPAPLRFFNFWPGIEADNWFLRFVRARIDPALLVGQRVNWYSVFGPARALQLVPGNLRIFFTGEHLGWEHYRSYADHGLGKGVDLSLGFDTLTHPRYLRFPLWIHYMFPPEARRAEVVRICEQLRHPPVEPRDRFACLVASHDVRGIRQRMLDALSAVGRVDSGGRFATNTRDLQERYANDKHRFLQAYLFNVCPENTNAPGYVTEKVFEAIAAGCIPIYWGGDQAPEPDVLNHDAILFWDDQEHHNTLLRTVTELMDHPARLAEFRQQPRLTPHAADFVCDTMDELAHRLTQLLRERRRRWW
jgi:hypothetical protein